MAASNKKPTRGDQSAPAERAVIYRGIRIQPMSGKRSPFAQAIRDDLHAMYEKLRAEPRQE
jgi:hypothetical protein